MSSLPETTADLPTPVIDTAAETPQGVSASGLNWLRAGVLGANDGIVSIAATVLGVAGATPDVKPILIAGVAALVLLTAALPFTLIAVLKTVRRARRRRRGGARDRIRGAWLEVEDLALDLRLTMPENPTRRQVAATYGGATVRSLARIADKAAFAPEEPTADEVEASWDAVDALHADRREVLSRWQQMRLAFTPRSLLPAALLERARGRDARRTAAA